MTLIPPAIQDSGIRDNFSRGSVAAFLQEKIREGSELSIVSAYFTIYAYEALKGNLDQIAHLRFLFGEPSFIRALDPNKTEKKAYGIRDNGLKLINQLSQRKAAKECAEWIAQKVEIRSVKQSNLLHGKMYHIANGGVEDAILGSSNFTVSGLGLGDHNNNFELNLVVDSNRDRRELKKWFEELWNDPDRVEDVRDEVLSYLEQLYQDNAPEFIYFKTLFHIFEASLSDESKDGIANLQPQIVDTEIWKMLFEFQKDGMRGAINKINTYGGCILADSVGLGKTFVALAVIKHFELRNQRVLVLCPKKLRENWTIYQAQNNSELNPLLRDRFSYTVLCHTDLSRDGGHSGDIDLDNFNWGNFDLVVIDESHNFRNNTPGRRDDNGNVIRMSRYERLMEDIIRSGIKTKVLLLSATPVNNNLKDLRNQIYFITENKDDVFKESLGLASIAETLRAAQVTFSDWAKKDQERNTGVLLERLSSAFFKLLDALTIARSRNHIKRFYKDSIDKLGGFPKREKPESIYSEIDLEGKFYTYDLLNVEIDNYKLSLFNPSFYLKPEFVNLYDKSTVKAFTQAKRENYLIGMMKVNFLKRLESSVHSFDLTLQRTINKIDELSARIRRFQQYQVENPDVDWDDLKIEDVDDEELQEAFAVSKAKIKMAHLDLTEWLKDLKRDRDKLFMLQLVANQVGADRDAKLARLKEIISKKVMSPTLTKSGVPNRKVLVFTAFADTATYLYENLKDWARQELGIHIAVVSGGSSENKTTLGKSDFNQILTNFSPIAKHRDRMHSMPQEEEIDLLIATDCISEGQNLQDCDTLINYDIHWNPVRVIQRFGRIDRIGSINPSVYLINFWPTQDLDKYITLKSRVEARMALVDLTATADDNLLNEAIEDLIKEDLRYRDKQLKKLKEEILDLEDVDDGISLTEFTLDDFRADLNRYIEANRKLLEDAPLGLYAIVPGTATNMIVQPGVIYCLKQKGEAKHGATVNPLQPYFLVYVRKDGVVRYNFTHPKQILTIFRELCDGKTSAYEDLCQCFNEQTHNGSEMQVYNDLLQKGLDEISKAYRKRAIGALTAGRGGVLPSENEQVNSQTEFELVTWLIIEKEAA
ncbi:superfamily II DNA/RNA helicase, SNF2 family [Longilinea arvoryzae]|uniref:Superfamily II DNA/RNA helicase, SNF2 family n=1 Tax=Longilinea arvoryzae TaxID=360412 RepID=A0A0K8MY04_9CHLR|nr:helicase-related protein [Longilinea arvoryzae]GAP16133.1 superfamily II DNA/RNA helicase, SNF2 family [Longilinea arvoryzae]